MREMVLITLKSIRMQGLYDLEVPADVPAGQLTEDIAEVMNNYLNEMLFDPADYVLKCERLKRVIGVDETFYEAGIWNGDIITLDLKKQETGKCI